MASVTTSSGLLKNLFAISGNPTLLAHFIRAVITGMQRLTQNHVARMIHRCLEHCSSSKIQHDLDKLPLGQAGNLSQLK